MPIRFLLDENLPGRLAAAIRSHNAMSQLTVDVVPV